MLQPLIATVRAQRMGALSLFLVIAGGTAKPKGFKDLFERALKDTSMPIEIAGVRMAKDPLSATARGALIAALYEK